MAGSQKHMKNKGNRQAKKHASPLVDSVTADFHKQDDQRPESEPADPEIAIISNLVDEVKERKEWAERKVIQAAEKICRHHTELRQLRFERVRVTIPEVEERKAKIKEARKKKLTEAENKLRQYIFEDDIAGKAMQWLETNNAKLRADIAAVELSTSETEELRLKIAKEEKKQLKKNKALEKQTNKLREELAEQKNKSLQLQQQLTARKKATEELEVRWRQEQQAKELAITQLQEEQRLKEEAGARFRMKQEAMYREMEADSQLRKDDVQRLEQEMNNLQLSLESAAAAPCHLPSELEHETETCSHPCWVCRKKEASVVFLPCAHQILCAGCSEDHCRDLEYRCPCCQSLISETIFVYGISS